jgi:LPS-assembly protein
MIINYLLKVTIVFIKVHSYKSNPILVFLLSFNCLLQANLPELSSINPIQFDEASQKLVAKGDALFQMDDLKIKADSIIYYKNYALLDASGNINLASQNHRLLADSFLYNAEAESFSLNFIKYGYWPYYIAAKSGGGSLEKINFNDVDFYIGEPKTFSPNLRAKTFRLENTLNDQIATLEKVQLRIGQIPIFYIPKIKYNLNRNAFSVSAKVGNSGEFGTYLETFSSLSLDECIKVGATVNLYSSRGILYGPAIQYNHIGPNLSIQGAFDSGIIHDDGDLGVDYSNQPIQSDRNYTIFQHKQKQDNTYTLTAQVINTSDTEVLRDFKETLFERNFNPLNFVEAILPLGNFLVSAFSHFDVGDLSRVRERLPEIQLSYLPSQIWNSNFYHSASLNYSDYKESTLNTPYSTTTDYLDYEVLSLNYRIAESFKTKHFLLIPSIQYRGFHFDSKQSSIDSLSFLDERFEFIQYGLKLRSEYQAKYETTNSLWNVKGLKHLFIPELSIQKIHLAQGNPENASLFRSFSISQPLTDISLSRDFESIKELFLTRLSFKNFFQTRYNDFAARNLMELHFTADFYHQMDALEDSSVDISKNAFWLEYALSPAPWLKLELASRLNSDDFSTSENRIRLLLRSADRWSLNINSYYIENIIDQLSLNYIYKLSEQSKLNTLLWGDIKEKQITRFRLGLETISNSNWRRSYYLNYRKDSRKTDELSFNVGLDLISF